MSSELEPSEKTANADQAGDEAGSERHAPTAAPRVEPGFESFGSVAPMSSPIVSVGGGGDFGGEASAQPAPSARKLVPPPKPKRDSLAPAAVEEQVENRAYFPQPTRSQAKAEIVPPPAATAPTPATAGSSAAIAPTRSSPELPKTPSFPPPTSSPPPTLPSGIGPSSKSYPWMSAATTALAEGKLPNAFVSQPMTSVPATSVPTTKELEPPPSSSPRAAVLPRATRDPLKRSSTPPPKPRLVPPRLQKETPSVAIEAMRIIAIGVDDAEKPEEPSKPERPAPVEPTRSPTLRLSSQPPPPAEPMASLEATALAAAPLPTDFGAESVSAVEPESPIEPQRPQEAPPAAAPVLSSVPRKPPPPRRVSLEPAPPAAESGNVEPIENVESVEPIESVESVEPIESIEQVENLEPPPTVPGTPAGMRPHPEPPPRPKSKPEAIESAPARQAPKAPALSEKPKRRAWWEELFNEDFSRAIARLTESQIEQDVNFIEASLGVVPGAVVLDLGCGCGDHAVELASRGYGVVGYDLSLYQLALAQEAAQERGQKINFLQGDMREMAFEEVFDGIYCWNTTFGYFEEDKNVAVLERIFRALKPGGALLLDVINRDFATGDQPSSLWYEGDSCVCMDDMSVDFLASRLRVKRSLILDDGRTRECNYSIRLYSIHELGKLLHDCGFRVTEASGHPATPGVFFGQSSPRIIILAQKP